MLQEINLNKPSLPKQWRHWCKEVGLKLISKHDKNWNRFAYMRGKGRYWRVNASGVFECSCPIPFLIDGQTA